MANHSNGVENRVEVMLEANEVGVLGASKSQFLWYDTCQISHCLAFIFPDNFLNVVI